MTRRKLEKTIDWALGRQGVPTETRQALVAAVSDAIELTLSQESEEGDAPAPPLSRPTLDDTRIQNLPPSPAVINPTLLDMHQPRLSIVPSVEPISPVIQSELNGTTFTPPREGAGPRGEPQLWKPEQLSKTLHDNTPARLKVIIEHPERGPVHVWLERNVVVSPGFDTVKLSYKHSNAPDEFQVAESFSVTQKELPILQALERIQKNATNMYTPKQRGLPRYSPQPQPTVAVTPAFDPDNPRDPTPHDSV